MKLDAHDGYDSGIDSAPPATTAVTVEEQRTWCRQPVGHRRPDMKTSVSHAPAKRGGKKLKANRRAGPEKSGIPSGSVPCAQAAQLATEKDRTATPTHVASQTGRGGLLRRDQGSCEGEDADGHLPPAGHRRERDEPQMVGVRAPARAAVGLGGTLALTRQGTAQMRNTAVDT